MEETRMQEQILKKLEHIAEKKMEVLGLEISGEMKKARNMTGWFAVLLAVVVSLAGAAEAQAQAT